MDAFVMTAGGSEAVRTCQQWLNGACIGARPVLHRTGRRALLAQRAARPGGAGVYTADMTRIVKVFQRFCMLPETGAGDPDRVGQAIDCKIPLSRATITTVKNHGYEIVGRYLTGGTTKVLTHSAACPPLQR
ncbi:hypothetical protein ACGFJ7_27630 [Actinoplanes sp. NPDC048988]|uniref:hypothetical protein n=1 Tax=Actinoplanes sp. NPDC048988 TaxID=3363901 RepID=UPI00372034E7